MFHNCLSLTRARNHRLFSPLVLPLRRINQSYYDILKVSQSCSAKEIRDAFILLSKKHHPDKHLNDPSTHETFVQINEAYSTLINPSKRRAYDLSLYHKRKLNAPYERPYAERRSSTYSDSFHKSSKSTFYDRESPQYSHYRSPFGWNEQTMGRSGGFDSKAAPKRYSNSTVVSFLIAFTIIGAIVQMLAIRKSFQSSHEKMVERSREYGLIHSMAQERARLYGNERQIEILRNGPMDDGDIKLHATQPKTQEPVSPPSPTPTNGKVKIETFEPTVKDKIKPVVVRNTEKCDRHDKTERNTLYCPKHQKHLNYPENGKTEAEKNISAHPKVCKKCNKRVNK